MLTMGQETGRHRINDWYHKRVSNVFRLGGPAGTGKSYLIQCIAEDVGVDKCLFMTPTGKASNRLIKLGLQSNTIHSRIYRNVNECSLDGEKSYENLIDIVKSSVENNKNYGEATPSFVLRDSSDFSQYDLFIVDEGSMVGSKLLDDLTALGKPILLVGDPNQLPPVNDFTVFKHCDYYLDEIVRQAQGSPVIWLSQQVLHGNIQVGNYGSCQVRKNDPTDYELQYADEVLVDTNELRTTFNNRMRTLFVHPRTPFEAFTVGEKIICRTNTHISSSNDFVLTNGAQGVISKIRHIHDNGKLIDLVMSTDELGDFTFIGTNSSHLFPIKIRPPRIEYAYAVTVHLSQGSEWNNVIYKVGNHMKKSSLYTAITRAKNSVLVVIPE